MNSKGNLECNSYAVSGVVCVFCEVEDSAAEVAYKFASVNPLRRQYSNIKFKSSSLSIEMLNFFSLSHMNFSERDCIGILSLSATRYFKLIISVFSLITTNTPSPPLLLFAFVTTHRRDPSAILLQGVVEESKRLLLRIIKWKEQLSLKGDIAGDNI